MQRSGPKASSAIVTYGCRSAGCHCFQSASVIIPDSLQYTFGWRAAARNGSRQLSMRCYRICGLRQVVNHQRQFGQLLREPGGMGQMLNEEQQVEGNPVFLQDFQAADHFVAHDEIVIGFIVGHVTNADELGVFPQLEQLLLALRAGQIDPAHDAGDKIEC